MSLFGQTAALTIALFVMLIGLVGVILPVLPGLVLVWFGILGYAVVEKFAAIDPLAFVFLTLLAAVGITADIWMTQLGAKLGGASWRSQLLGMAGGLAGAIAFFFLGGISAGLGALIGSVTGVLLGEYWRYEDSAKALRSGAGWLLGWLASMVFQFAIGGVMIAIFVWQVFRG
jgi:uncharacterized protein YqgC (DUF456 family)